MTHPTDTDAVTAGAGGAAGWVAWPSPDSETLTWEQMLRVARGPIPGEHDASR